MKLLVSLTLLILSTSAALRYSSLQIGVAKQEAPNFIRELAFNVKVEDDSDSNNSTNSSNHPTDDKVHVKLKVGSKKLETHEASYTASAKLETATIDDTGKVTIEEHSLQYCRLGRGYIPYYLTFANAVEDKGVLKLPLHQGGDLYSLLRFQCRNNKRVCAFLVPRRFAGSASEEQYLSRVGDSFDPEQERFIEALNIPYLGPLPGGGTMPGVGFGYVGVPPGEENMQDYLNRESEVRDDPEVTNIDNYMFEFGFSGLGYKLGADGKPVLGYYETPFGHIFENFASEGTNTKSKYIYLSFPKQVKYFATDFLTIARRIADRGAFNKSLGDYTAVKVPGEDIKESDTDNDDCVGCNVRFTKDKAKKTISKISDREYALKLMAISPFVIDISNQEPPEYMLKEAYRSGPGKKKVEPPKDAADEFALRLADKVTEEELMEGEPEIGTYIYINVRSECSSVLSPTGLKNILGKCVFGNIGDKLESLFEKGKVDRNKVYCSWGKSTPPADIVRALLNGELGSQQSMYIELGVPVISSLTLDRPDGKSINRGITHSVVAQAWNELGLEPDSIVGKLNLVELFYVLDKIDGMDGEDLLKKGYMPNIQEYIEKMRENSEGEADLESVKSLLKEDLERIRFRKAPVVITMTTLVKLYPRISKSSPLYGFYNAPLGPYIIRLYTFLGNDLSALFRNVINITAPLAIPSPGLSVSPSATKAAQGKPKECSSNKYLNPYIEQFLVTLKDAYNYKFGEVHLKVQEAGGKLVTEFEFYTTPEFKVPNYYLSLKDDAEKIKECFPFVASEVEE